MEKNYWDTLKKGGPFAILFGVLLWVFISDVRADQKSTRAEHAEIRAEDTASDTQIKNALGQLLLSQERSVYLQRRQCINSARNATDREACIKDKD